MLKRNSAHQTIFAAIIAVSICLWVGISPAFAQRPAPRDPAEPQQGLPHPKLLPRPAAAIARQTVDVKSMRALIDQLVSCGTRLSLSSWTDPKRGIGCGRDHMSLASTKSLKTRAASCKSWSTNTNPPPSARPENHSLWKVSTPFCRAPTPDSRKHSSSSPAISIRAHLT